MVSKQKGRALGGGGLSGSNNPKCFNIFSLQRIEPFERLQKQQHLSSVVVMLYQLVLYGLLLSYTQEVKGSGYQRHPLLRNYLIQVVMQLVVGRKRKKQIQTVNYKIPRLKQQQRQTDSRHDNKQIQHGRVYL